MIAVAKESDLLSSCSLSQSILSKDTDSVKRIILERQKSSTPLIIDNRGWTALHLAASNEDYAESLELILQNKRILLLDIDCKTSNGETALYLACEKGCVKNCTILLGSGCNPELSTLDSSTPLHAASEYGHAAIVSQLLAYCDLNTNCQDSKGRTPLHVASKNGNLEVVRVLMTNKQTKVNIPDDDHCFPLHLACFCRSDHNNAFEIVKILLKVDQSLIDSQNYYRETPLMIASRWATDKCVKYLLDHGANADRSSCYHVTCLDVAAKDGNKEKLELLLQATSSLFIREEYLLQIQRMVSVDYEYVESLVTSVMSSGSPECLSILLKFGLPKSILEAPYLKFVDYSVIVYSPVAFLFRQFEWNKLDRSKVDQFLQLLLDHGILHMNEFRTMIELTSLADVRYVHPFTSILRASILWWSHSVCSRYLDMLIEKGITIDYCLQCDVDCDIPFQDFNEYHVERFYVPVVWAIDQGDAEIVHSFLINSAILEPPHLWKYLRNRVRHTKENFPNIMNYLMTLADNSSEFADAWKIIDDRNLTVHSHREPFKYLDLRKICRNVLRKELRDVTVADNLKNYRRKIDTLSVPQKVIDFLHFKRM